MVTRICLVSLAFLATGCLSTAGLGNLVPPTADQDPALPQVRVRVSGRERALHLRAFGDPAAPLLLVLHGSLSDHRGMMPLAALSDRYRVVLWDQRGNGLSERVTTDEYTWDSVVEEIDAVRERLGPGRPVTLVGHSFGAMYASLYASRRPQEVAQLALLEPGGLNGEIFTATFEQIITIDLFDVQMARTFWQSELLSPDDHEAMDYKALQLLLNGHTARYHCDRDHPAPYPVWRPGAHVEWVRSLRMGAAGFSTPRFEFDFARGLTSFGPAVLLVGADCSALGPDYQRRWHAPLFREARVAEVHGAGHRLVVEKPDEVLALLRGYLAAYRAP